MSSSNTSSLLPPPPPSLESNNTTTNMYNHSLSYSNSSSTKPTEKFGSHAPAIRKAMQILEAQFGHPHISLLSSSSNNKNSINIVNNKKMMMMNDAAAFYPPDLSAGSSTQSRELPPQTFNVAATAGVDVGNGKKNKRKKKTKTINRARIHSLSHLKYGPYTCSKCLEVVPTSQKFANHVTKHYKLDKEEEEKKRNTSEAQEISNLQFDQSEVAPVNNEDHTLIAPAPPLSGLKVKIEPADN